MQAMVFEGLGKPLVLKEVATPRPDAHQLLIEVRACAVCRTDLHIVDGELPRPKLPLILGHEIVGVVAGLGDEVARIKLGDRVGVPWLGWTCGVCEYLPYGAGEPLRQGALHRLRHRRRIRPIHRRRRALLLPASRRFTPTSRRRRCFAPASSAIDRCALPVEGRRLGIYGFGAAAHIIAQVAQHLGWEIYAFTRPGDVAAEAFARECGAAWTGGSLTPPPEPLDAALIFAPVGALVPAALHALAKGGTVVCGGIHMSDIPSFPYADLWEERMIRSVANLTRRDAEEFLALAPQIPVRTRAIAYPLERANEALEDLRHGRISGAAVLVPPAISA